MSLKKIAEVKKRKRRFSTGDGVYEGDGYAGSGQGAGGYAGSDLAAGDISGSRYSGGDAGSNIDPEGSADASRGNNTAGIEGQGGFGGPGAGSDGGGMTPAQIAAYVASFSKKDDEQKASMAHNMMNAQQMRAGQMGLGLLGVPAPMGAAVMGKLNDYSGRERVGFSVDDAAGIGQRGDNSGNEDNRGNGPDDTRPFGNETPVQTTPLPGSTGARRYVWDPQARQYVLANLGAQDNPMGYTQGQVFKMAAGGPVPSGIAAGMPRFVQGDGTGLSDDVPVQMDDGGEGRLADGEFVVPADVVSGLGGGSSAAGSKMLFDMMERIRQQAHGKSQQIRPVNPQQVLPA